MKAILLATVVATGIGLVGMAPSASAAPASGITISGTAKLGTPVVKVQHSIRRSARRHKCHIRRRSGWRWCY